MGLPPFEGKEAAAGPADATQRVDVDYHDRDVNAHAEHRTKRLILETYDELAEAIATGRPYQTRLDPPPADPRVAQPPRSTVMS